MIISFLIGLLGGITVSYFAIKISKRLTSYNDYKKTRKLFTEIEEKLILKQTTFVNRVKDSVLIETSLENQGIVTIIYIIEKKEVLLFKKEKFITSSVQIKDKLFVKKIIDQIEANHKEQINDVVEILGVQLSRKYLNDQLNQQILELSNKFQNIQKEKEELHIDTILDKISATGLKSLTKEEIEFLNNYK